MKSVPEMENIKGKQKKKNNEEDKQIHGKRQLEPSK